MFFIFIFSFPHECSLLLSCPWSFAHRTSYFIKSFLEITDPVPLRTDLLVQPSEGSLISKFWWVSQSHVSFKDPVPQPPSTTTFTECLQCSQRWARHAGFKGQKDMVLGLQQLMAEVHMNKMITSPVTELMPSQSYRQEVLESSVEERCGLPRFRQK